MRKVRTIFIVIAAIGIITLLRILASETSSLETQERDIVSAEKSPIYNEIFKSSLHHETRRAKKKAHYFTTKASKVMIHRLGFEYKQKLPEVIGIGVKKCGTTALFRFLDLHPNIVLPHKPEIHFFDTENYQRGLEYYRLQMPFTAPNEMAIEKTPRYFVLPAVPARIKQMSDKTKLLLVVCDPIKRAYSDFKFEIGRKYKKLLKVNKNAPFYANFDEFVEAVLSVIKQQQTKWKGTFEKHLLKSWSPSRYYLSLLNTGVYSVFLKHWLRYFPMNQIHVINGDELITDPVKVLREVQSFIGIDVAVDERDLVFDEKKGYFCIKKYRRDDLIQCMSEHKGTTRNISINDMMSKSTLLSLQNFYSGFNAELFKIIGKSFDWT